VVRLLIDHVGVAVSADDATLEAQVHWSGGEVTSLALARGRRGINRYVATSDLIELLRTLARGASPGRSSSAASSRSTFSSARDATGRREFSR
jgi:hypothetical protein